MTVLDRAGCSSARAMGDSELRPLRTRGLTSVTTAFSRINGRTANVVCISAVVPGCWELRSARGVSSQSGAPSEILADHRELQRRPPRGGAQAPVTLLHNRWPGMPSAFDDRVPAVEKHRPPSFSEPLRRRSRRETAGRVAVRQRSALSIPLAVSGRPSRRSGMPAATRARHRGLPAQLPSAVRAGQRRHQPPRAGRAR